MQIVRVLVSMRTGISHMDGDLQLMYTLLDSVVCVSDIELNFLFPLFSRAAIHMEAQRRLQNEKLAS